MIFSTAGLAGGVNRTVKRYTKLSVIDRRVKGIDMRVISLYLAIPNVDVVVEFPERLKSLASEAIDFRGLQDPVLVAVVGLDGAGAEVRIEAPLEGNGGDFSVLEMVGCAGSHPDIRIGAWTSGAPSAARMPAKSGATRNRGLFTVETIRIFPRRTGKILLTGYLTC